MNAPFSRLPRFSPPPLPSQFAPTMPMEALAGHEAGDDWHDTQPQAGTADDLLDLVPAGEALAAETSFRPAPAWSTAAAQDTALPAPDAADSDFHEPMGGLHMRELESPELFEHLFGPAAGA